MIGAKVQTGAGRRRGRGDREVQPDTPAERAGLEKGDVVTAVDGDRVTDGIALIVTIRTHQPGETWSSPSSPRRRGATVEVTLGSEVG